MFYAVRLPHLLLVLQVLVIPSFGQSGQQQFDPLNDFCRRFEHQTTIIDNKLFIDGGLVDYGGSV